MSQPLAAPLRVVVIDGNEDEREATIALCRQCGLLVNGWSHSGAAGLELFESLPTAPDLVILDLQLPDMDSADLLLALSMLAPATSIVICSAVCERIQDTALTLAATLGLTALGALPKPAPAAALMAAVRDCPRAVHAAAKALPLPHPASTVPPLVDAAAVIEGMRTGQFELYYQPKVALGGGALQGAEALLRWHLPGHGLLAPCAFLPQVEAAGVMDVLTMEVVRMALRDWNDGNRSGLALPISLNLSPLSLTDPHLASQLIAAVSAACVPPAYLTFEIVEHAEIADLATALRILIKLRLHGFGLSLDDFGAGHASLLRLSRFPFNELKLDRRLVHEASRRPHIKPLLRHAIATARELGVTSVAEGVETEPDLLLLRELDCDLAQGYLIARPMRAAALPDWHLQWVREHAYPDATRSQVLPLRRRHHAASAPGTGRKG